MAESRHNGLATAHLYNSTAEVLGLLLAGGQLPAVACPLLPSLPPTDEYEQALPKVQHGAVRGAIQFILFAPRAMVSMAVFGRGLRTRPSAARPPWIALATARCSTTVHRSAAHGRCRRSGMAWCGELAAPSSRHTQDEGTWAGFEVEEDTFDERAGYGDWVSAHTA